MLRSFSITILKVIQVWATRQLLSSLFSYSTSFVSVMLGSVLHLKQQLKYELVVCQTFSQHYCRRCTLLMCDAEDHSLLGVWVAVAGRNHKAPAVVWTMRGSFSLSGHISTPTWAQGKYHNIEAVIRMLYQTNLYHHAEAFKTVRGGEVDKQEGLDQHDTKERMVWLQSTVFWSKQSRLHMIKPQNEVFLKETHKQINKSALISTQTPWL